jgi:hypothetical protein
LQWHPNKRATLQKRQAQKKAGPRQACLDMVSTMAKGVFKNPPIPEHRLK